MNLPSKDYDKKCMIDTWCRRLVHGAVLLLVFVQSEAAHLTERHHLLVGQASLLPLPRSPPPLVLLPPDLVLGPGGAEEVVAAPQVHVA